MIPVVPANDQGMPKELRYQFIPRVLIFLEKGGQILLLNGAPDKKIWANQYNGLGGHIERGENVLQAAKREVYEESGLEPKDLWLCANITIDTEIDVGIVMWVFRGTAPNQKLIASGEGTLEWIEFDEISKLPLVVDLPQLIPAIFNLERNSAPLWGRYWYDKNGKFQMDLPVP